MKCVLNLTLVVVFLASCTKKEDHEWGEIDDGVYEIKNKIYYGNDEENSSGTVDFTLRITIKDEKQSFFVLEQREYGKNNWFLSNLELEDGYGNVLYEFRDLSLPAYELKARYNYHTNYFTKDGVNDKEQRVTKGIRKISKSILDKTEKVIAYAYRVKMYKGNAFRFDEKGIYIVDRKMKKIYIPINPHL